MKIMAVDLGEVRTGLAVCDRTEFLASPVGTLEETNQDILTQKVAIAAKEYAVEMVIVGHPVNMDGSCGARAKTCETFAEKLKGLIPLPVVLWDERQSTMLAHRYLNETNTRGKQRKHVIDEVAASIILESYLQYRKNNSQTQCNEKP